MHCAPYSQPQTTDPPAETPAPASAHTTAPNTEAPGPPAPEAAPPAKLSTLDYPPAHRTHPTPQPIKARSRVSLLKHKPVILPPTYSITHALLVAFPKFSKSPHFQTTFFARSISTSCGIPSPAWQFSQQNIPIPQNLHRRHPRQPNSG